MPGDPVKNTNFFSNAAGFLWRLHQVLVDTVLISMSSNYIARGQRAADFEHQPE